MISKVIKLESNKMLLAWTLDSVGNRIWSKFCVLHGDNVLNFEHISEISYLIKTWSYGLSEENLSIPIKWHQPYVTMICMCCAHVVRVKKIYFKLNKLVEIIWPNRICPTIFRTLAPCLLASPTVRFLFWICFVIALIKLGKP